MRKHTCLTYLLWILILLIVGGCSWGSRSQPGWIMGTSAQFPPGRYVLGLGEGSNGRQAAERAYAAVAKNFHAEVQSLSRDWESYGMTVDSEEEYVSRQLVVERMTQVTTDKILEHVQILDRWVISEKEQYFVLAGIDRIQAEQGIVERIGEYDRLIQHDVARARETSKKVRRLTHLKRAITMLKLRETYNRDLRVIRQSGKGIPSPFQIRILIQELTQFLGTRLLVTVEVVGGHAESLKVAVVEALTQKGFRVIGDPRSLHGQDSADVGSVGPTPDYVMKGEGVLEALDLPDPLFTYVRWCGEFRIIEQATQRVIGIASESGREGHVTQNAAFARALQHMQHTLSTRVVDTLSAYLYGEREEMVLDVPLACHHRAR